VLILGKRRLHLFLANRVDLEACAVDHDGFRAPSNRTRGVAARRRRHASAHHCLPAVFPHGVFPIRSQAPVTKIVQGWPKLWANFRALIGIFNQSVGPGLAIWANPVEFSSVPCGGGRQADGRRGVCVGAMFRRLCSRCGGTSSTPQPRRSGCSALQSRASGGSSTNAPTVCGEGGRWDPRTHTNIALMSSPVPSAALNAHTT
jgi:hypothetical protein